MKTYLLISFFKNAKLESGKNDSLILVWNKNFIFESIWSSLHFKFYFLSNSLAIKQPKTLHTVSSLIKEKYKICFNPYQTFFKINLQFFPLIENDDLSFRSYNEDCDLPRYLARRINTAAVSYTHLYRRKFQPASWYCLFYLIKVINVCLHSICMFRVK